MITRIGLLLFFRRDRPRFASFLSGSCCKEQYFQRYVSYRPQNTPFRSRLVGFRPLSKMLCWQHFATASILCTFSRLLYVGNGTKQCKALGDVVDLGTRVHVERSETVIRCLCLQIWCQQVVLTSSMLLTVIHWVFTPG